MITVTYTSVDYFRKRRTFKTLKGARRFAQEYIGAHPSIGTGYAISDDGVGRITVSGATLADLFPDEDSGAASVEAYNADAYDPAFDDRFSIAATAHLYRAPSYAKPCCTCDARQLEAVGCGCGFDDICF